MSVNETLITNVRAYFMDWFEAQFDKEADFTDGQTYLLWTAFKAGYSCSDFVDKEDGEAVVAEVIAQSMSPIKVKQTAESARDIGRQLREEFRQTTHQGLVNDRPIVAEASLDRSEFDGSH